MSRRGGRDARRTGPDERYRSDPGATVATSVLALEGTPLIVRSGVRQELEVVD
jgi:hypothetical protein